MSNAIDQYMKELEDSKVDLKRAIIAKGVTPTGGLSSYADAIKRIPSGGGSKLSSLNETLTENGAYSFRATDDGIDGYSRVDINVDIEIPEIPTFETQSKSVEIKKNGTQTITPDSGYDGLSSVEVKVNVASTTGKMTIPNGFRFTGGDMSLINWSAYDWSGVYDFAFFFENCTASDPSWTVEFGENVINQMTHPVSFQSMFTKSKFTELDLSTWDTSKVYSMAGMCLDCPQLQTINISGWDYRGLVKPSDNILIQCLGTSTLKMGSSVTSLMFTKCPQLTNITGVAPVQDNMNPSYLTAENSSVISSMFAGTPFTSIPQFEPLEDLTSVVGLCSSMEKLTDISALKNINWSKVTNMSQMVQSCPSLSDISPLKNIVTSNVTNMSSLFYGCYSLEINDELDNWDMSKVVDISSMFYGLSNAKRVTVNKFDFDKLSSPTGYNMENAFRYANMLEVSGICRPKTLYYAFAYVRGLISNLVIDLTYCTNTSYAFSQSQISKITLIGDPSKITNYSNMFSGIGSGGTISYDSQYDYSKILALVPSSWTIEAI